MSQKKRKTRLEKRNTKIKERFIQLSNKRTEGGVKLYTNDAIIEKVSNEYYLAPATITDIIFNKK